MCPDSQLLSIYIDGELPSPWKEKMESHLTECSECSEKYKKLLRMRDLFNKETPQTAEADLMEEVKERIWQKLESGHRFRTGGINSNRQVNRHNVWKRKVSVPIPLAAAAAIVIVFMTILWPRTGSVNNNGFANPAVAPNFTLATEGIPEIIPTGDLGSVLEYLGVDRSEVIILQLPESGNFSRSGDPAVIRSADYTRR